MKLRIGPGLPDCPTCSGSGRELIRGPRPDGRKLICPHPFDKAVSVVECKCAADLRWILDGLPAPWEGCRDCDGDGWVRSDLTAPVEGGPPIFPRSPLSPDLLVEPCTCRWEEHPTATARQEAPRPSLDASKARAEARESLF